MKAQGSGGEGWVVASAFGILSVDYSQWQDHLEDSTETLQPVAYFTLRTHAWILSFPSMRLCPASLNYTQFDRAE